MTMATVTHGIIDKCREAMTDAMRGARADWYKPSHAEAKVVTNDGFIELYNAPTGPEAVVVHNNWSDCECVTLSEAIEAALPAWSTIDEMAPDDNDYDDDYDPHDALPYGYADWGAQFRM